MNFLKKIFLLLSPNEKKESIFLVIFLIFVAVIDAIGVASIIPFLSVVSDPGIIKSNIILSFVYENLNFGSERDFLIFSGLIFFLFLVFSLSFKAFATYKQLKFTMYLEYSIGRRLVEGYLNQNYAWYLNKHSSNLGKSILSEVSAVVDTAFRPFFNLIAHTFVTIAIIILLFIVNPEVLFYAIMVLASSYFLIFKLVYKSLKRIGQERFKNNQSRFNVVSELFNSIKEVKIGALEKIFIERFSSPAKNYATNQAIYKSISTLPRFAIEILAFGGLLLFVLLLIYINQNLGEIITLLIIYAFAGYRLIPSLQQIYSSNIQLQYSIPAVNSLNQDISSFDALLAHSDNTPERLHFDSCINIKNVFYKYSDEENYTLNDVSINIPKNAKVGIVGLSGSGKTTLLDLILGLLTPSEGRIEVGEELISNANIRSWQALIGYVPQDINLSDAPLASNIAFGESPKEINQEKVVSLIKLTGLMDIYKGDTQAIFEKNIGENGVRLSGGQRQRIGLARALYKSPKLLVLDEATSSLDNHTERLIMNSLSINAQDITTLVVAHRLSTIKDCDLIYILDSGKVVGSGKYDELKHTNKFFQLIQDKEIDKKNVK